MPITLECPGCRKSYRVQDTHAGKKIRCKSCETIIHIPYEEVEVLDEEEDDWGDDEPWNAPSESSLPKRRPSASQRRAKSKRSSRKRSSASDSMPEGLIVVLVMLGVFIALSGLILIGEVARGQMGKAGVTGFRIAIEVALILGLVNRSNIARQIGVGLFLLSFLGSLVIGSLAFGEGEKAGPTSIIIFIALFVVSLTGMVLLNSRAVADYCTE